MLDARERQVNVNVLKVKSLIVGKATLLILQVKHTCAEGRLMIIKKGTRVGACLSTPLLRILKTYPEILILTYCGIITEHLFY